MKKITAEEFINKCKQVHGNRYDYTNTYYVHSHKKINIICKTHGSFLQRASSHVQGNGCPKCAEQQHKQHLKFLQIQNSTKKRKSITNFITEAQIIHNNKFDYSKVEYINTHTPVTIICKKHGEFNQRPIKHLLGSGCPTCATELITEKRIQASSQSFVAKAKTIHGQKYCYDDVDYQTAHTHISIICPEHGEFKQTPNCHLNGHGCPKCGWKGYYSDAWFMSHPEQMVIPACLYLIKIINKTNEKETFIKVGITTRTIKERFNNLYQLGYVVKTLKQISPLPLYIAYIIEQNILEVLSKNIYVPAKKFEGYTECFEEHTNIVNFLEDYFNYVEQYYKSHGLHVSNDNKRFQSN